MSFPDPTSLLQSAGFRAASDSGFQMRPSANANCVFIYGWTIDSVRLWYSVFLVECLDFKLFYISVCKRRTFMASGGTGPPSELPGGGGAAPAPDDEWIVTAVRRASETSCEFGSAGDVTHTNLQNLFNTKMGVPLPNLP